MRRFNKSVRIAGVTALLMMMFAGISCNPDWAVAPVLITNNGRDPIHIESAKVDIGETFKNSLPRYSTVDWEITRNDITLGTLTISVDEMDNREPETEGYIDITFNEPVYFELEIEITRSQNVTATFASVLDD